MWQVLNRTPFAADRAWARDRNGAEVWLVAVRCTFQIHPDGTTQPAADQDPVVVAPKHFGEPATTGLRYDTDFVLTKPTTDVILHGSAYAPNRRAATAVDVGLFLGDIRKVLRVTGEREYLQPLIGGLTVGPIKPFIKLGLGYERSYGGRDPEPVRNDRPRFEERNPVGTGFVPVAGKFVPSIEYLNGVKRPAGFGPIPPHWKPRVTHAGTYDENWNKNRRPLYPRDLDDRFFLCSPEDQRPAAFLKGGELVELANLTPEGRLRFILPRVALGFETRFRSGERVRHPGFLYTVILEPDAARVILVWRTSLPCHPKVQSLLSTTVWQKRIRTVKSGRGAPVEVVDEDDLA